MTWAQIHDLGSDGNEIAGHSLTHAHLTQLSTADLQHEICDDRTNLLNQGFSPVLSFAYPYAEYNATVEAMVSQCGYLSGRTVGGILSGNQCGSCPTAETLPPRDAFATRTPEDISSSTSLAEMETYVTQAEQNGGGWVQVVFHGIGDQGGVPPPYQIRWRARNSGQHVLTAVATDAAGNPATSAPVTVTVR